MTDLQLATTSGIIFLISLIGYVFFAIKAIKNFNAVGYIYTHLICGGSMALSGVIFIVYLIDFLIKNAR